MPITRAFQLSGTLVKLDAENLVRISRKDKFMVLLPNIQLGYIRKKHRALRMDSGGVKDGTRDSAVLLKDKGDSLDAEGLGRVGVARHDLVSAFVANCEGRVFMSALTIEGRPQMCSLRPPFNV